MVSIKSGKPYAKLKKTTPPPPKKEVLTKENPKKVKETSTEGSLENEKDCQDKEKKRKRENTISIS